MRRLRRIAEAMNPARPSAPVVPLGCSTPNLDESPEAAARALLADESVAADFAIGINPDVPAEVIEAMERLTHG